MGKTKITERILDLTLEIICLLTGESFLPLKAGDRVTITMPPPNTLILKGDSDQKILDVISKITELLTGEVSVRCQDITVYFSMEEWEYLEGHKELYKGVMTEDKETQTSADGSCYDNPSKRCSSPYFGDSSQEGYSTPPKDQDEELINAKVELKGFMDVKFEDDEPIDTKCEEEEPINAKFKEEEPINAKFKEEEPINAKFEDEEPNDTKAEGEEEEEESYMMGDQPIEEEVMMVTIKEEDFSSDYELYGHANTSEGHPDLSPDGELEDYTEEDSRSSQPHQKHFNSYRFPGPSNRQGSSTGRGGCYSVGESSIDGPDNATPGGGGRSNELFSCSECGKSFTSKSSLRGHQKLHTGERPFSCTVCGKTFIRRTHLNIHQTTHVGERPFKCTECGKGFSQNSDLRKHLFSHSGEFPFSCSDCGKGFPRKSELIRHRRSHTGERPYECTQCGKCFMDKSQLTAHKRYHSGERPYVCSECGKSFTGKSELNRHWSVHSGLKPFWCFECGKGFTLKSSLVTHQRRHAGDMQYSCSECGKSFVARSALARHEVIHTGIKPYPCSKCNKSYLDKSQLIKHELVHAASQS